MIQNDIIVRNVSDKIAEAVRYISGGEVFVLGHYPHKALFPGVLSLDLLIQLSEVLLKNRASLKIIERVQYLHTIVPGDICFIKCEIKKQTDAGVFVVSGEVKKGDHVAVRTKMIFS